MAETTRKALTKNKYECMFTEMDQSESTLELFVIPFNILLGTTSAILCKSSIEFICAQAPYNMIGLLIGLCFNLNTFFSLLEQYCMRYGRTTGLTFWTPVHVVSGST